MEVGSLERELVSVRSYIVGWALCPCHWCPCEKGTFGDTCTQREGHVEMAAGSWAKEPQGRQRPGRGLVQRLPEPQQPPALLQLQFGISGLGNLETVNFCELSHSLWLRHGSPRKRSAS